MVLDASLLNTQHYKVQVKGNWSNSEKGVAPPTHLGIVAIKKGNFGFLSITVGQLIYIYIYIYIDPWPSRQSEMHLCKLGDEEAEVSGRYERV